MTIKQIMLGLSALALSASLTPAAYAATDTGTLTVKAHIGAACTLKTKNATLDFGNLASTGDANHNAETSITVQCSSGQPYNIALGKGQNWNDDIGRQMKNGTSLLEYYLFQDAARTLLWQPGNYTRPELSATGNGNDQKHMIYGRIFDDAPAVASGDYVDTIVITVGYYPPPLFPETKHVQTFGASGTCLRAGFRQRNTGGIFIGVAGVPQPDNASPHRLSDPAQ